MRCSRSYGSLYILILLCIMFVKANRELKKRNHNHFQVLRENVNSINDWGLVPVMTNNRFHKIVKKQMSVSDYLQAKKRKRSAMSDRKDFDSVLKKDQNDAKNICTFFDKISKLPDSIATKNVEFHQKFRKDTKNDELTIKKDDFQDKPKTNKEGKLDDMKNLVGHPCKYYARFVDKGDTHNFYECEVDSDGCMKFRHRKCPEGEIFAPEYLECLKESYLKIIRRPKRNQTPEYSRKIDVPDSIPDGDPEPANEWLDASQGTNPKIPSEFKPKRKPKLRIYHLRCKRKLKKLLSKTVPQTYSETSPVRTEVAKSKRQVLRRHHPRSFLVRLNKKDDNENKKQENQENEEDEENDEEDEEEGEDDDDENETDEDTKNVKKEESQSSALKEAPKNVYKSSRTPNKVKFDEGSSYTNDDKFSCLSDNPTAPNEPEDFKKVLIDASIKVDSAISSALKNILSKKKEKR